MPDGLTIEPRAISATICLREIDAMIGSDDNEDPNAYLDGMTALGWTPYLVMHEDGSASLFERLPDRPWIAADDEARRISAYWAATEERRQAVKRCMIERGLVAQA
ncbi:hypothetical protein [Inquilinus limosus]|uniref:hypothetical protein n=1 Tax=Inquilinus limosus TaxID=171674 RepID=UPI0012DC2E1F|nr:hypothetical protein [Inquilinus limosus]